MTRKSEARLARDEFKKNNRCWSDLKEVYTSNFEALSVSGLGVAQLYSIPGLLANVPEPKRVSIALQGLDKDIQECKERLNAIHATHQNREGGFTDDDDYIASLKIFEQYQQYVGMFTANTMQTIAYLMEQGQAAANKMAETQESTPPVIEVTKTEA